MQRLYMIVAALILSLGAGCAAQAAETLLWPQQQHVWIGPTVRPEPRIPFQPSPSAHEYAGASTFPGGHSGNVVILNDKGNSVPHNLVINAVTGAAQTSPFSAAAPAPVVMGQWATKLTRNSVMLGRVRVQGPVSGATANDIPVQANSVVITSDSILDAPAYGALSASGPVSGNTIYMMGGAALALSGGGSESGEVSGNNVYFSGGDAGLHVEGGRSAGAVNGNKVFMSGGTTGVVRGGLSARADAKGNRVEVRGGIVAEAVIGGQSLGGSSPLTTHNTVDIHTFAALAPEVRIYGGLAGGHTPLSPATAPKDVKECQRSHQQKPDMVRQQAVGNVLNFFAFSGTVRSIEYFQYITMRLPHSLRPGDTLVQVTESMDLRGVSLRISGAEAALNMQPGESITLLTAPAIITDTNTLLPTATVGLPSGQKAELHLSIAHGKKTSAVIATVEKIL